LCATAAAALKTRFWRLKAESTCQHLHTPIGGYARGFEGADLGAELKPAGRSDDHSGTIRCDRACLLR
jgi:hypothetical protein